MKPYPALALFTVGLFVLMSILGTTVPFAIKSSAAVPSSSAAACPGSSGPCPMGVADLGVNRNSHYSYTAVAFKSTVTFTSLNIGAVSVGGSGEMSVQLNAVADRIFRNGVAGF